MAKSIVLLTIAAFALSGPLHARALSMPAIGKESAAGNTSPDPDRSQCSLEAAERPNAADLTGSLPDTGAGDQEAHTTSCCWVFMWGRWWCMSC